MSAAVSAAKLGRLYTNLARYNWLCRWLRRSPAGTGLEMHKRLGPPASSGEGPPAGLQGVHGWLYQLTRDAPVGPMLDLGCGFGATLFDWLGRERESAVGVNACGFQLRKARAQAESLGLAQRIEFRQQSYQQPLHGRFAKIVAVECLLYSTDLHATLRNVAAVALPGAVLVLLEDMSEADDSAGADADLALLQSSWHVENLHSRGHYEQALAGAGFDVQRTLDLTGQVITGDLEALARRARRLRFLARLPLPVVGDVARAYLGGIALERLYARGLFRYRALVARRVSHSANS